MLRFYTGRIMKKGCLLAVSALIWACNAAHAQTFFNQNFNTTVPGTTFPTGWQAVQDGDPNTEWKVVAAPFTKYTISLSGGRFAICDADAGGSGSVTNSTLTSPEVNTAAANILILEFFQAYRDYSATPTDSAIVEVFNGTNWIAVQKKNTSTANNGGTTEKASYVITPYKNSAMKIRFRYVGEWPWFWGVDNIRIYQPPANDLGVSAIVSPTGDCGLSASTIVKVAVTNFGSAAQSSVPVSYQLGASGPVQSQTFTASLQPGQTQEFSFTSTLNLSAPGNYRIKAWTTLSGDVGVANDSSSTIVTKTNPVAILPVNFQSFDGSNLSDNYPGWREASGSSPAGTTSLWRSSNTVQNTNFGTKTGAINLFTTGKREWLISPSILVGPNTGVTFKLAATVWQNIQSIQMGSDDSLKIMVTTNCGNSWQTLAFFNRASGLTNQLANKVIPLGTAFNGQEVRIGFLATEGLIDDPEDYDLHIDDIEIRNIPDKDISVSAISSPLSGCTGVAPVLTALVKNVGIQTQSNFQVCYRINTTTPVCTTIAAPITSNQELSLSFPAATAALNAPGDYNITVYSNLVGDADRQNDTIKNYSFQNVPLINTFPYFQSFESNNGGWIPGGTLSSWQLGTPAKTVIQGAAHGTKAYVTGGLGNQKYNNNEKSFVLSPCMNFTSLTNPVFEMRAWWHSEAEADGACVQATLNGGASWVTIGTLNAVSNWYNTTGNTGLSPLASNPLTGWSGGVKYANGSNGWVLVRAPFPASFSSQPDVKVRIVFGSNASVNGDGFAFDAIRIIDRPAVDLAAAAFERPLKGGCGFVSNSKVVLRIQNQGEDTIRNATFSYRVGNGAIVNETVSNLSVGENQFYNHVFTTGADLSSGNSFSFRGWAKIANDIVPQNDTVFTIIKRNGPFEDTIVFNGFNNINLGDIWPGWSVANGLLLPDNANGQWRAPFSGQVPYVTPAAIRLNMFGSSRNEWILSPGYLVSPNSYLGFDIATTAAFDTTNPANGGFNGTDDKLRILISTNCGDTWTELTSFGDGSNINRVFKRVYANLSAFAQQEIRFAFKATTGPVDNGNNYDLFLRNIAIEFFSPNDVGVASILSPTISCGLAENTPVKIAVKNFSNTAVSDVLVYYQINNGPKAFGFVPGPIAPSQTAEFTFSQTANLSISQPYTILAGTQLSGDVSILNDTKEITLRKLTVPVPVQDITTYNGSNLNAVLPGWSEGSGALPAPGSSSWTSGLIAGQNCFKVKLAGAQKNDWIFTPGVKLTSSNFLKFTAGQFAVGATGPAAFDVDDTVSVMVSTNCGTSWSKLFSFAKNTTPALSNALQQFSIPLNAYNNQEVRFAFRAVDGTRIDDTSDVYISGFEINSTLSFDAGPTQIIFNPAIATNSFLVDSSYKVIARVNNFGVQSCTGFNVGARFANGQVFSRPYTETLQPGQSDTLYLGVFQPNALATNQSAKLYTSLSGDQAADNDTLYFAYIVSDPLSVSDLYGKSRLVIYPNPSGGEFSFSGLEDASADVVVSDAMGRLIFQGSVDGAGNQTVRLPEIPAGLYAVKVRERYGRWMQNFSLMITR